MANNELAKERGGGRDLRAILYMYKTVIFCAVHGWFGQYCNKIKTGVVTLKIR